MINLTKEEQKQAKKVAFYYRCPDLVDFYMKEQLEQAIKNNVFIHYEALNINKRMWKGKRW